MRPLAALPIRPFVFLLGLLLATGASAAEEAVLVDAINAYRAQPQNCGNQPTVALTPLASDPRLALPTGNGETWRAALEQSGYRPGDVRTIRLTGPADAQAAFKALLGYCDVLLNPQFVDVGVSQAGPVWRVTFARPLRSAALAAGPLQGPMLLEQVNAARAQPRLCGNEPFASAPPLRWNEALGAAATNHSQSMALNGFFAHQGTDGSAPADRARSAGYAGTRVAESIAAGMGSAASAVQGWLASPEECSRLMSPLFTDLGGAQSPAAKAGGVYWTLLLGAP
ncbi:CAP domain-containing protein [Pseudomonas tohonis]|uniref:CAP domain-containing protein n=1 Tax=Pseudomonas tohonis TaxID=2725477 RepID=UPI001F439D72|nr:CAP domain-containing protein [Pseudomonas tohonis]